MKETMLNLAGAEEARKAQIQELASEEYDKQYEDIMRTLDRAHSSIAEVNYADDRKSGLQGRTFTSLVQAVKAGDLEKANKVLILDENDRQRLQIHSNMHPDTVYAVMRSTNDFLKRFGLDRYVRFTTGMNTDEIKRAIDIGYAARMWELTNRYDQTE